MAQDEIDNESAGLFNISISDSEEDDVDTSHGIANSKKSREDRTGQSEDAFQAVKREYRAKVENGEIWKSTVVPLGPRRVPKHEGQELLHAVEELYFFRRFEEAVLFVGRIFDGEGGGDGLDKDVRDLLRTYERKCNEKLGR
ncbi:hypothetical protein N8I77_002432 [Diaporthe amygdali]|uniref:Uncharacterized protein n=1 Tax=Phomopsis amygdali TaxID=1214568 RepID=A0AAD9SUR8_PHOAM|nr:hypothetical protein N8I77_002432 [Diaporthe amygdali]